MVAQKKKVSKKNESAMHGASNKTALEAMHDTARDFYQAGIMDMETMRKFDALCLPEIPNYSPAQIKAIRLKCKASQAVFAKYMNISMSSLQKWEIGEKKPMMQLQN